jgi:hypothetical protein
MGTPNRLDNRKRNGILQTAISLSTLLGRERFIDGGRKPLSHTTGIARTVPLDNMRNEETEHVKISETIRFSFPQGNIQPLEGRAKRSFPSH